MPTRKGHGGLSLWRGLAAGLIVGFMAPAGGPFPLGLTVELRDALKKLSEPDPLDVRAREVSEALARARDLLGELQAEVTARSEIIEGLAEKTTQAEQRAQDAAARAGLTEEQSAAVDALLVSALKTRLAELERRARRREWGLATVVALVVGVAAILISHFLIGF